MHLQKSIAEVRKRSGLTQEEFAAKLFVTRQAVSRWEQGQTTPEVATLKKMAETFNISLNELLCAENPPVCQSCAMPLRKIDDFGSNGDQTVNPEYCHYCYKDGHFTHERTVEEMVESNLRFLGEFNAENGTTYTEDEARTILKHHLQTLARWRKQ